MEGINVEVLTNRFPQTVMTRVLKHFIMIRAILPLRSGQYIDACLNKRQVRGFAAYRAFDNPRQAAAAVLPIYVPLIRKLSRQVSQVPFCPIKFSGLEKIRLLK